MQIGTVIYEEYNGNISIPFKDDAIGLKGIWAMYGKENEESDYRCLNVGKCKNIGEEIIYDLACMHYIAYREDGTEKYINQFNEECGFSYKPGQPIEYLYPYLALKYPIFKFIYVCEENDRKKEKEYATKNHSLFWRNGRPWRSKSKNLLNLN